MKRAAAFAFAFLTAISAHADVPLQLSGAAIEGGLVIGKTSPGAVVTLSGKAVEVAPDGHFLLGFGRDSAGAETLTVSVGNDRVTRSIEVEDRTFKIERIDGLPDRKVSPMDPKDLARIKIEKAAMDEAKTLREARLGFLSGFRWPATGRISGVYGSQRVLNGKPRRPHFGTDVAAPVGTPIGAMAAGRVVFVHPGMFFNGKTVLIDHGLGLQSVYIHMSDARVKAGDWVEPGDIIGAIGKTGRATGPHLHFGLTLNGLPLDPELMLGKMP
jgi:murein DD-endopeptidase MepM/ murein hydrolase activator NlpD